MHTADEWSPGDAANFIARPTDLDDKYTRGVLGVATGSDTYPGAAVLGVDAALSTGVGMVRYRGPERCAELVLMACPEAVAASGRVQAWLAGSGMGEIPTELGAEVLDSGVPLVLDAGALDLAGRSAAPTVITPHNRELARLVGVDVSQVDGARASVAADAAASLGVVVLLKGSRTVVASPDGEVLTCPPASPWLATAGTGDVLAGILGALVATHARSLADDPERRMLARLAASASVIHSLAAARASGAGPMTVRALVASLPATIAELLA